MWLNALVDSRLHRYVRRITLCIALAVLAGVGYSVYWARFEHGFTTITARQLYQSARVPPEKLFEIADRYGVRTVIDLRTAEDATATEAERQALEDNRLAYIHLPTAQEPDQQTVRRVMEIVGNSANRPVLVYCHLGSGRAVLLTSIFRIEIVNWDSETARRTVEPLHWCGHFPPDQPEGRYLLSFVRNRPRTTFVGPEE